MKTYSIYILLHNGVATRMERNCHHIIQAMETAKDEAKSLNDQWNLVKEISVEEVYTGQHLL